MLLNVYLVTIFSNGDHETLKPFTNKQEVLKGIEEFLLEMEAEKDEENLPVILNKDYGYWQWTTKEYSLDFNVSVPVL